jgi:hypothetical protein
VQPTRLIAMKTPLTQALIDQHFPPEQPCPFPHTIAHLLSTCRDHGYKLGMIINLAAHDCLYAADMPEGLPMKHTRLTAKVLPPADKVQAVIEMVDAFWSCHPDQYIAIHCDYGVHQPTPLRIYLCLCRGNAHQWLH